MSCRCAPALLRLEADLSKRYPNRDKTSEGCCGDAAHAARISDHNPAKFGPGKGYAHAGDIDENLNPGTDEGDRPLEWLWNLWVKTPDRRIKYLIYERRIFFTSTRDMQVYTGLNAHGHHMHVSIQPWTTFDVSEWVFEPRTVEDDDMRDAYATPPGAPGQAHVRLKIAEQRLEGWHGARIDYPGAEDNIFGLSLLELSTLHLNEPAEAMEPMPNGVRLHASDGGVFDFPVTYR